IGLRVELDEASIDAGAPAVVSLGQLLELSGGGFVGGGPDQVTLVHIHGSFAPVDGPPVAIDTIVVPTFVDGQTLRYALNEDDQLGHLLAPRGSGGVLTGVVTPIVSFGDDEVVGGAHDFTLGIAPVRQVVYLHFTSQYAAGLRTFGLHAVEALVRARILQVVERDYATVNLDVRTEPPTDFAVFSEVEIGGADPNGLSLLGYDNTPGKDNGNLR